MKASAIDPPLRLPPPPASSHYRFHTMIKPGGASCNLDCTYCYYLHKQDLLAQPQQPRMPDDLLEAHIRQYIAAQSGPQVVFSWQGGEPTLMGLAFFERVVALQARYRRPGQAIENDLQTNGLLLDDAWCAFLRKHAFMVGISIDGPPALHDLHRRNKGGKATAGRVMAAVALLHRHRVPFSALCVVNRDNAQQPLAVYRFLRDTVRPRVIQFIPGVARAADLARDSRVDGVNSDDGAGQAAGWSVPSAAWGLFLRTVWHEWMARDFGNVFVDQFENIISQLFGHGPQKCVSGQYCGKALAIEHNGDVYSCDHFVYPAYKLGNIRSTHEGDLAFSERQRQFGCAKSDRLPQYCRRCAYLKLCWGECPRNRFIQSPDGEAGLNYLCEGLKMFYATAVAAHAEIALRLGLPTAAKPQAT